MVKRIEHRTRTGCPIACSLDIIGDHWTLLIVRNLLFLGIHEYKDMLACEEKISSGVLSDRLKKMQAAGMVGCVSHPRDQKRKLYYLTPRGKDLIHAMVELVLWANTHLSEFLDIPPDKKAQLERDPAAFKEAMLVELSAWEKQHLHG